MKLDEMITLFMESRKRGTTGARKKSSPATLKIYRDNLRAFQSFFLSELKDGAITDYRDIRKMHFLAFLDWMDKKEDRGEWAKATRLQILRTLRTFFRWVEQDEDCQMCELKGYQRWLPAIEKNPRRLDIPEVKDLKTFKNTWNTKDKWEYRDFVVTCLLTDTGLRIGEICNLKVTDILWGEHILIVNGKTGMRTVPVTKDMLVVLKGWLKKRDGCGRYAKESPYVFVSKRAPQMTNQSFGQSFRKHRLKINGARITPHTFRHAYATHYLRGGGDLARLKDNMGHSTFEMLMGYVHMAKVGNEASKKELEKVSLLKQL